MELDLEKIILQRYRDYHCEGLPGVYSTIWCLCYKTNKLKKRKEKEGDRPG